MTPSQSYVLVTGATGFIGAHVVDNLLQRGIKVRAATRSLQKGEQLRAARQRYSSQLDIVQVGDFSDATSFSEAVKDVTGVIHVASPFSYSTTDNEKELILPAIAGVRAILEAAEREKSVERVVITSSFASVMNADRKAPPRFTYTAEDWNPLTYEESIDKKTSAVIAYRGSKKFAELEAWKFAERKPGFDIVTLCPPMTFGPTCHPVANLAGLNESNATLWKVASGKELPVSRVPFWVDVRDLATAHVEALIRPEVGGKRFVVASPEKFSYGLVGEIVAEGFSWGKERVAKGEKQVIDDSYDLDGEKAAKELGLKYTPFSETVKDFVKQAVRMEEQEKEA
ncbi:3-beta hydroxysteroid dehydrogenase/isomerase family protein [Melanomma pulvis-pyrius CBS 109.77]|uniref:3-beta hydroxysteroid dehydrogenase/isomerase family protein n=1 Tax=Melanomma pulvis-pyrius CBS 109.77 TaxID=1314802 RepID=A0A6A6XDQ7_9PLEO|nr:3-beta hydroxysteroid dehydrogenase/isomerase family protein [Melanomma pulvis-pyrius CBS 109.77]